MRRIIKLSSFIFAVLVLHGCGQSSDEDKVSGVGLLSGAGDHQSSSDSSSSVSSKPFPKLDPVYPSMENLAGHPQPFPKVYPVNSYPGSHVSLVRIEGHQGPGIMNQVELKSPDPPHLVDTYYAVGLIKNGWKLTHEFENQVFGTSTWEKDGQQVEVRVSPDPHGGDAIQLFWGMAPNAPKIKPTTALAH